MDFEQRDEIRNKCVRKLAFHMRTEREMRDFLKTLEIEKEDIDDTIDYLKDLDYLDDVRYAMEFYRVNKSKCKSDLRIKNEIALKGINSEIFDEALEKLGEDEEYSKEIKSDKESAGEVALKMKKNQLDDGKEIDDRFKARVARRLAGLGYSSSLIYDIIGRL